MLTALGRKLRELRMGRNLLLKDMADSLRVSSAYLSAVEMGRKAIPPDFVESLSNAMQLSDREERELRQACDQSVKEVRLRLPPGLKEEDRETAAVLARQFGNLTASDFAELREILHRRRS